MQLTHRHSPHAPAAELAAVTTRRGVAVCAVAAVPAAVPQLRHFTRATLALWRVAGEPADAIELIVCELVTNSYRHSGSRSLSVRLAYRPTGVRIDVRDAGRWRAGRATYAADDEDGRGLTGIVGELAEEWGHACSRRGTRAWARVLVDGGGT